MDSYYEYIWDVTILEYLTCILSLRCHYRELTWAVHGWKKSFSYPSTFP